MSKKTYTVAAQRLEAGRGYVECLPHQATRFVVLETTLWPARKSQKSYRVSRNFQTYCGSGAQRRAQEHCNRLTAGTKAKPVESATGRKIWGRSLTSQEYFATLDKRNPMGGF